MRNALLVGYGQRVRHRNRNREQPFEWQAAPGHHVGQRVAVDQFHGHDRVVIEVFDRIDRDDVRVIEGGDRPLGSR
jgi:hypothetical protein